MADDELTRLFYDAARAETLVRIQQRDLSVFTFIGVVGAYFGFVFANQVSEAPSPALFWTETVSVLALPVICVCFMLVYQQHHLLIAMLERYINVELYPDAKPPHLNASKSLGGLTGLAHEFGFFAQSGMIAAPQLFAFVYLWRNDGLDGSSIRLHWPPGVNLNIVQGVFWILIGSLALNILIAFYAYLQRVRLRHRVRATK